MDKLIKFLLKHIKTIILILTPTSNALAIYFTELYKVLNQAKLYGAPVFVFIFLSGLAIGCFMRVIIRLEDGRDPRDISIPSGKCIGTEFIVIDGVMVELCKYENDIVDAGSFLFCPDCEGNLAQRKSILGWFIYKCPGCKNEYKSEFTKEDLFSYAVTNYRNKHSIK